VIFPIANVDIVIDYPLDYTTQDFLRSLQSAPFPHHEEIIAMVCITHCRKDFTRNLDLKDDVLSSYTFQYWGAHFRMGPATGATLRKARVDFVLEICQERRLPDSKLIEEGLDYEYRNDPASPNPEDGLRAGYNACLMVTFLDLMDLYHEVAHLHGPSTSLQLNALHIAARAGNQRAVQVLLDEHTHPPLSAILNSHDSKGRTPLMLACEYGHTGVVRQLLACVSNDMASVGTSGTQGRLNTTEHFSHPTHPPLDLKATDSNGLTALHYSSFRGHFDIVKLLLAYPSKPLLNLNAGTNDGFTAFHIASWFGRLNIVELLLNHPTQHPLDLNTTAEGGMTPLYSACIGRHFNIVRLLLAHPSKPPFNLNVTDDTGMTALYLASCFGHLDIVQALLNYPTEHPIDLNATDRDGCTALHVASSNGHLAVVKELLAHGAAPNARTRVGETALMMASLIKPWHDNDLRERKCAAKSYLLSLPDIDLEGYSDEPDPGL